MSSGKAGHGSRTRIFSALVDIKQSFSPGSWGWGGDRSLGRRLWNTGTETWYLGFNSFGGPPVHFKIVSLALKSSVLSALEEHG